MVASSIVLLGRFTTDSAAAQDPCANAAIRAPLSGEMLQGNIPVLGSARIDDFNFFKVEYAPASDPERWQAVSHTKNEPVLNSLLDQWNTESVGDGSYRLKLTVVDSLHQEVCRIMVPGLIVANRSDVSPTPTGTDIPVATAAPEEIEADAADAQTESVPTPTLAPILPGDATSEPDDIFDPSTWLDLLQVGAWVRAFLQGFVLGWAIALLFLLVQYLRRSR